MSILGVSTTGAYAASQPVQPPGQHRHGRHQASSSISDVQNSTPAPASGAADKAGKKVDITA
jgi:hypothetical protein